MHGERVGHFEYYGAGFFEAIRFGQYLPAANAVSFGAVSLDVLYGAWFPTPRMVYDKFGIDPENAIEFIGVQQRCAGDIAKSLHSIHFQARGEPAPDTPEIRERAVCPVFSAETHLVKRCYAHTVGIRFAMLGFDIHRNLCQIHVRPNAGSGGNAGCLQYVAYHSHGEVVWSGFVDSQILCGIYENLVDGIHVNVFGGYVLEVDVVYAAAYLHVMVHAWRSDQVTEGFGRV